MTGRAYIILLLFSMNAFPLAAQVPASKTGAGAYLVPFDTEGNRIELTVANETATTYDEVEVRVVEAPGWVDIDRDDDSRTNVIPAEPVPTKSGAGIQGETGRFLDPRLRGDDGVWAIESKDSRLFGFTFSTDDSAPTEEVHPLIFDLYSGDELVTTKQIDIVVELPKELVLRGNYPNPFNPSTTIGFVQPEDGDVTLDVFDALGRLVDRLTKYGAKRGQQTFSWNATSRATGVYFYRLQLQSESGGKETRLGKMLLVR